MNVSPSQAKYWCIPVRCVLVIRTLSPAQAKGTLRLTLDAANTAEEIDTAAAVITACVQRLRDGVR